MRKPTNSIQAQMKTNLVSTFSGTASTGALVNNTTALGINNGEVAMLSSDLDASDYGSVSATPQGNMVKLIQGTPKSNNTQTVDAWGISDPAMVETTDVIKGAVRSITTSNYSSGSLAMSAFSNLPTIAPNNEYGVVIELDGRRQENEFGQNTDQISNTVTTPQVLPAAPVDFVLQTLATRLNSRSILTGSTKRFVVLGMSTDASGGGTALSALVNNNSVINFQTSNGVTYGIQSTTSLIRGFAKLIESSDLTSASTIVVLNGTTAGDAASVDTIVVVGIDATLSAYVDDMFQVRTDVDINPSEELESEGSISKVYASESNGDGRSIVLASRHRAQLNIHTQQLTPYMEYFSEGYTYLKEDKNYGTTRIDFTGTESTIDHTYTYEKQATIYWEQAEAINLTVSTVIASTPSGTKPAAIGTFATWSGVTQRTV
jgi:hypothetical protein